MRLTDQLAGWVALLGTLGTIACGTSRVVPRGEIASPVARAVRAQSLKLLVFDERADERFLGHAVGAGKPARARLELNEPASDIVRRAFSDALLATGYSLGDDTDVVYRIEVREFSASYTHRLGSDETDAKAALDVKVERAGAVVGRRFITGRGRIEDTQSSAARSITRWALGNWAEWGLAGVPGVGEATGQAVYSAVQKALEDPQLNMALDPFAVVDLARSAAGEARIYRRRVAVVIGISDYWLWPPLEHAVADARRVAQALRGAGFDEVIEIHDEDATREHILRVLGLELQGRTQPDDLIVIYFAGHGDTETLADGRKRGYIVPVDADTRFVFSTAISMAELRDLSHRVPARHIYFAMESCYSGVGFAPPLPERTGDADQTPLLRSTRSVQMITAGIEKQAALTDGREGLFTSFWIRALQGEADRDGDGYVTGSEIANFVAVRVRMASGNRQSPQHGRLDGSADALFPVR